MKQMRKIRKPLIKLGKVRLGNIHTKRLFLDSHQILKELSPRMQRVLVKVKQSYAESPGAWRGHGRYLERDKARSGTGFSQTSDDVSISRELNHWQNQGDYKLHKIILSPEYAERIDLKVHTRELMQQVEKDLDRKLTWVAIVHKNTDNHHVHIALRGVDANGKSLDIEEYLGKTLRERSQDLITRQLGPRLYPEILEKRNAEIEITRFTDIDRLLLWKADENNLVVVSRRAVNDWKRVKSRAQERSRLEYLSRLGLAERVDRDSWYLSKNFRENLRSLALRDQLVKDQVPGWEFVRTINKSGVIRKTLKVGEKLTGKVVGLDLRDPFGDKKFMLIEGITGETYHINQPRGVKLEKIKAGGVLTLERLALESSFARKNFRVREFTAVRAHRDWENSYLIAVEAAKTLRKGIVNSESLKGVGFLKEWQQVVLAKAKNLEAMGFDPFGPNWKEELEKMYLEDAHLKIIPWNPKKYLVGEKVVNDKSRFVVGEVKANTDSKILVEDVRDGVCRAINLKDIGLTWPTNVGSFVSIAAKIPPHTELRPSDERIAELLSKHEAFSEGDLNQGESRFVISRANTWQRWDILENDEEGFFRVAKAYKAKTKENILQLMEAKLTEVRANFNAEVRKQPAWLKQVRLDALLNDSLRFGALDRMLNTIDQLPENAPRSRLGDALRERAEFWKERKIEIDRNFEKNARRYLKEEREKQRELILEKEEPGR